MVEPPYTAQPPASAQTCSPSTLPYSVEEIAKVVMIRAETEKSRRREKMQRETQAMKQRVKRLQMDLRHRNNEKVQLQEDYKKADKSLNRYNYVTRIGEIIKTVKKQEVEIKRILADTLQVQREINTAEESLGRAYTLADEVIFRGAKSTKSVESKDMYVRFLLCSTHNFSLSLSFSLTR